MYEYKESFVVFHKQFTQHIVHTVLEENYELIKT